MTLQCSCSNTAESSPGSNVDDNRHLLRAVHRASPSGPFAKGTLVVAQCYDTLAETALSRVTRRS